MRYLPSLWALLAVACAGSGSQAAPQVATAQTGEMVWSAFQCAAFGGTAGEAKEAERLFALGLDNGRRFLEAVQAGKITAEKVRKTVPIAVTMRMRGPSVDFILGGIYTTAQDDASNRIIKTGYKGETLDVKDWIMDSEVQKIRAGTEFRTRNCALLK